ncbi:hypothetical protein O0I10_011647 [Lichtheimia ornata]|uniref:Heterokaryon incompatibility domain-containing protein n=1 Tax=Lichtheimia ornata TaxID=688661 RepID=A0AAD7XWJ5_9FUNG|nr:uncharacterized protein O0I10_011647 [Lichtheimia ornata]KAJ8652702.1 hypothetical protein O0I10_011647 [Lichtheimia ornata]
MTRNADEYNDPYKIDIKDLQFLHKFRDRKEYFEKALSALLADEHFLLLYVPDHNGAKMQIVRPANDAYHRRRMIKIVNERRPGRPVPSCYYALSHLWGLTENNRYLWHEIGDYVDDEQGQPAAPVSMRPEKRDTLLALLKSHPDSYWWIDVLCARTDTPLDIMGDIYACCLECVAMIDCEPSLLSKFLKKENTFLGSWFAAPTPLFHPQRLSLIKGPWLIKLLGTFLQSGWWQRVWTWQEMALPLGDVRFMAETDAHGFQNNTITLNELDYFGREVYKVQASDERNGDAAREIYSILQGITCAKTSTSDRKGGDDFTARFQLIMLSLRYSKRRCYDPADYVYGVLGMMQIKIPRVEDPNAAWSHLLSKLDDLLPLKYSRWVDSADEFDLREAETIGDVYTKLVEIYADPIPTLECYTLLKSTSWQD